MITFRNFVWLMVLSAVIVLSIAARRVYYVESIVADETSYSNLFKRTFGLSKRDFDADKLWIKASEQKVRVGNRYVYPIYPVSVVDIDSVVMMCANHDAIFVSFIDACNEHYLIEDRVSHKSLGYPSSLIKKQKLVHKYSIKGNEYLTDGLDDGLKDNTSTRIWEMLQIDDTDPVISTANKKVSVIYFLVSQWLWGDDSRALDVLKRISTVSHPEFDRYFKLDSFSMFEYGNTIDPFGDYVNERRGFSVNGKVIPATQYCGTLMIKEEMFNKSLLSVMANGSVYENTNADDLYEWLSWLVGVGYYKEGKYKSDDEVLTNVRHVYNRLVRYRNKLPLVGGWFVNYLAFGDYLSSFYKNFFIAQSGTNVGFCVGGR